MPLWMATSNLPVMNIQTMAGGTILPLSCSGMTAKCRLMGTIEELPSKGAPLALAM